LGIAEIKNCFQQIMITQFFHILGFASIDAYQCLVSMPINAHKLHIEYEANPTFSSLSRQPKPLFNAFQVLRDPFYSFFSPLTTPHHMKHETMLSKRKPMKSRRFMLAS
jgi:hypothetical protein